MTRIDQKRARRLTKLQRGSKLTRKRFSKRRIYEILVNLKEEYMKYIAENLKEVSSLNRENPGSTETELTDTELILN